MLPYARCVLPKKLRHTYERYDAQLNLKLVSAQIVNAIACTCHERMQVCQVKTLPNSYGHIYINVNYITSTNNIVHVI